MRSRLTLLLVMLIFTSLAFAAGQKDKSRAFWEAKYQSIVHMFATKDTTAFIAILDPKFTYIDEKGKSHSRAEFIKLEVDPIRTASKVGGTVKVTSVAFKGDTVAVSYDWRYQITAGKTKDVGREVGTDVWHKVGGKWLTIKTIVKSASDKQSKV